MGAIPVSQKVQKLFDGILTKELPDIREQAFHQAMSVYEYFEVLLKKQDSQALRAMEMYQKEFDKMRHLWDNK